jgi:disulfide bond formation protein DsbB
MPATPGALSRLTPRHLLALCAALGLGAVGIALLTQHVGGMMPCPWCVLQRVQFLALAAVALVGLALSSKTAQRWLAAVVLLLAVSGVAAALWQHFVAASSTSCNLTLADRIVGGLWLDGLLPEVFAAYASCADAAVKIAGLPYEFYSGVLFVMIGGMALAVWRR